MPNPPLSPEDRALVERVAASGMVGSFAARLEALALNSYPHMCRDEHDQIGWRGDDERCPVCRERDQLRTQVSDLTAQVETRIADAEFWQGAAERNGEASDSLRAVIERLKAEKAEALERLLRLTLESRKADGGESTVFAETSRAESCLQRMGVDWMAAEADPAQTAGDE